MPHNSTFVILLSDLNDCIDQTLAVRRTARIHDLAQLSPSIGEAASAAGRGVLEALIAGDSGGDCRDPACLRMERVIVMVSGRVPGSAKCHWRQYKMPARGPGMVMFEVGLVSP